MVSRKLGQFWGIIFTIIFLYSFDVFAISNEKALDNAFYEKYSCPLQGWEDRSRSFYCDGKYISLNQLIERADAGESKTQYTLGLLYQQGYFGEIDYKNVLKYYTLAVEQDNPLAMYGLASMYNNGRGIKKDREKAIHYYEMCSKYPRAGCEFFLDILTNPDNTLSEQAMQRHFEFLKTAKCQLDSDEWVNECTGIYSSTIAMNECIKAEAEKCTEKWLYFVKNKDVLESQKKDIQKKCREQTDFSGTIGTVNASFCVLDEIKNKIKGLQKL
ncbi:MAG: sel1 repeat family protein [Alphaproteobacteria bacterium]|nr:sel1 repeat family protein [Alphaproteobacteria bacterium]